MATIDSREARTSEELATANKPEEPRQARCQTPTGPLAAPLPRSSRDPIAYQDDIWNEALTNIACATRSVLPAIEVAVPNYWPT